MADLKPGEEYNVTLEPFEVKFTSGFIRRFKENEEQIARLTGAYSELIERVRKLENRK